VLALDAPANEAKPASRVLLVGWYDTSELSHTRPPGYPSEELIATLIGRLTIRSDFALDSRRPVEIEVPAAAAHLFVLVVEKGEFWPALFASAPEGNFVGGADLPTPATPGELRLSVELAPVPTRSGSAPERCQGPRHRLVVVQAPEVAGRVKNPTARRLCVYLPPSYAAQKAHRYPVAYLLPGLTSTDTAYVTGTQSLAEAADDFSAEHKGELILVGVDTSTRTGSTYLVDSENSGAWENFLTQRVVATIDKSFRTIRKPEARALVGQSTGGFNAISYGLRHSDTFSVIGASAPDGLDVEGWLTEGGRVRPLWLAWTRLEDAVGGTGQMVSYASDWSPDASARGFAWPFSLEDGTLDAKVFAEWRAHSPLAMLGDEKIAAAVKQHLSGRISIAVAKNDEFDLYRPAKTFSDALDALGVEHRFSAEEAGHFQGSRDRLRAALAFALERMPAR
jgi:S-formylglutathione hydrolase FrmB